MAANIRATLIHPDKTSEERIEECVLRNFPGDMTVVSIPARRTPQWTTTGCDVVVGSDGRLITAFTVRDVGWIDLAEHDVEDLPDWNGEVVSLYPQ